MKEAVGHHAQVMGFIPDAEPGFVAATLAGFDGGGYRLTGTGTSPGRAVIADMGENSRL